MTPWQLQALSQNETLTMSSLEIAELTGKQHRNVLADIRNMIDQLGLSSAEFSAVYKDQQLINRPCFNLPKDLTLTLITGYSIPLRHKINQRWMELE
jgi:phage regulator Rha-like protein